MRKRRIWRLLWSDNIWELVIGNWLFTGNVGSNHAIFEQGASAGNVGNEKIVEQKKANPVALLLSSAMMLRHLQFPSFADRLENAVKRVIMEDKCRTKDLGGHCGTQDVVDAVIAYLDWHTYLFSLARFYYYLFNFLLLLFKFLYQINDGEFFFKVSLGWD